LGSAGDILAEIHKVGTVLEEEFLADGTRVRAYVPPSLRNKLQQYVVATTGESVD
jgi:GTP-binding protein HflX